MSFDSCLIDAVSEAITLGYTPERFIKEVAEQWNLELKERAERAAFEFGRILHKGSEQQ